MSETLESEEEFRFLADQSNPTVDERGDVPIDHGWAWVVLAASIVINVLYAGVLKSFGIFFIEILDVYGGAVSTTSLISGLQFTVYCTANVPVLMILLRYQSVRTCQLIGITFSSLAYALSSLTTRLDLLILCQSLLNGLSIALIVPTGIVLVGRYFRKHIGLANGMLMAALSLGGLVMPPLIQNIVREYTLHGALLLTSGIVFNALPAAILQRPPEFYRRIYRIKTKGLLASKQGIVFPNPKHTNEVNSLVGKVNEIRLKHHISTSETELPKKTTQNGKTIINGDGSLNASSMPNLLYSQHQKYISEDQYQKEATDGKRFKLKLQQFSSLPTFECTSVSNISISQENLFTNQALSKTETKTVETSSLCSMLCRTFTNCIESGRMLLKNRLFLIFVGFYTTGTISNETITLYLPPFAKENGIESSKIAMLISIHSVCDFLGRVLCGWLADLGGIRKHHIILVSQVFTALLPQLAYFYNSFLMFAIFAASFGFMSGVIFAISNPVLKEIVGDEHFASAIAIAIFIKGAVLGGMIPLLGYLRDATCTYHVTFHCMGATSVVAVCVLVLFSSVIPKHSSPGV
ncbi:monocarboxylate transporter 12-like [Ylistrum balloti]|uniref:monocarboxylate transporter 12-like n=1 Tax=Ylistrum balloti TaxID=509963 RepID=UPI0029058738|nr:monocarboxylate transporter 12-like [Ylistrum balloti]